MLDYTSKLHMLEMVANGHTYKEIGEFNETSASNVRLIVGNKCKELRIPFDLGYIRKNKNEIIKIITEKNEIQSSKLSNRLQYILLKATNKNNIKELTPEFISSIIGPRLLNIEGIGPGSILEINSWLKEYGHSLKPTKPESSKDFIYVNQAITILEIYAFDVSKLKNKISAIPNDKNKKTKLIKK